MYNLFLSHSWSYKDAHVHLLDLLNLANRFPYRPHWVQRDHPVHAAQNAVLLKRAIHSEMQSCNVVIVMAGVFPLYRPWINEEISLAGRGFEVPKPILLIEPWSSEGTTEVERANADKIVPWDQLEIITALRELEFQHREMSARRTRPLSNSAA
ncbi:MAG: TIR domain-containing protein [Rhodobacteraceae bacterium]|nr:TIR domain-containing protein [Paracoccaceae bacterium]